MGTTGSVRKISERRSLLYIRLAAYLADRPSEVQRIVLTTAEVESLIGAPLPAIARFPSWWRNDEHRVHSRAWLTAGWRVEQKPGPVTSIAFVRVA